MSARCTYEWIIPFTQHQATAWDQNTSYGLYLYCFRSISDNYSMYILYYIIMFMHAVFGVENHRNPFKYSPWIFSESRSRKNRSCMFSQQISDEGVYLHWYLLQAREKEREIIMMFVWDLINPSADPGIGSSCQSTYSRRRLHQLYNCMHLSGLSWSITCFVLGRNKSTFKKVYCLTYYYAHTRWCYILWST